VTVTLRDRGNWYGYMHTIILLLTSTRLGSGRPSPIFMGGAKMPILSHTGKVCGFKGSGRGAEKEWVQQRCGK